MTTLFTSNYWKVTTLAKRALANGALLASPRTVHWNMAGGCTDPIQRDMYAKGSGAHLPGLTVEMVYRCRKCDNCRWCRRMQWQDKATIECALASRNWFGTLTFRPDMQDHILSVARHKSHGNGYDFEGFSPKEQFIKLCEAASRYHTLYLKRVRKNSGSRFRFLLVAEAHKSGKPHYHMLVHEQCMDIVPHRVLTECWVHGFTNWKLVLDGPIEGYVCKYLSKSAAARVRASLHYGGNTSLPARVFRTKKLEPPAVAEEHSEASTLTPQLSFCGLDTE